MGHPARGAGGYNQSIPGLDGLVEIHPRGWDGWAEYINGNMTPGLGHIHDNPTLGHGLD